MRRTVKLLEGWDVKSFTPAEDPAEGWKQVRPETEGWMKTDIPATAQEVLWREGMLDKGVLETGEGESVRWASDLDWAFHKEFRAEAGAGRAFLNFKGLDTYADIVLNGRRIGGHWSLYKPRMIEVTGELEADNHLVVYLHSPFSLKEKIAEHIPEEQRDKLSPFGLMRKGIDDLSAHAGAMPYFCPIGIYGDVELITVPRGMIRYLDTEITFTQHRTEAYVSLCAETEYAGIEHAGRLEAVLYAPDGSVAARACGEAAEKPGLVMTVKSPQLWWPRNYGSQPLYLLKTELYIGGRLADADERWIGFREIREAGPLHFRVNGKQVRLWGSCLVPVWGASHEYPEERMRTLIGFAERGNMNILRFWGPSQQYDDRIYEELDRRGILVWQDFPTSGTHMSEDPGFVACARSEAEAMIRRLKHHPCILLWCGGNESPYMCDLFDPEAEKRIGHSLVYDTLRKTAFELDPRREYRVSSPIGGVYANDPAVDSHGSRASLSYLPGEKYGNFFSENIRTSLPELKSIRRFIPPEELWLEDWTDRVPYGRTELLPPAWQRRTMNHWSEKTGPSERFYDADTPEELVYKFNAATAYDMRLLLNACRRGKDAAADALDRKCFGHIIWKLTTSWPQMYCALVDYYLEPNQVYYALRRSFAPVQVSVDVEDHVYIWGVNDTPAPFTGEVRVRIYDLEAEKDFYRESFPVSILPDDARVLLNLDRVGQFPFTGAVEVTLADAEGKTVSRDVQYMKAERYLPFPDAEIEMSCTPEGEITLRSDRFVRCVELGGDEAGDAFGWYFEDNYFDMFPGETYTVRLWGKHASGTVTAKGHYASRAAEITWNGSPGTGPASSEALS